MDRYSLARGLVLLLAILGLLLALVGLADSWNQSRKETDKVRSEKEKIEQLYEQLEKKYQKLKISKRATNEKKTAQTSSKPVLQTAVTPPTDKNSITQAIYNQFWPDTRILALVNCESGWRRDAVGYDASHNQYNYGLFQISQYHGYSFEYLKNPYNNIQVARQIYDRQGWGAWPTCSRLAGLI
jgi:hypothetical protein